MNVQKTGSLIATIRKEQNRTQQDLANELGVSSAAVSKWERGIGFPDVSLMEPLAASLGISIAELFKGERTENNVDNEYESLLSDVVKVSANEITRKKKITNWMIDCYYCCCSLFDDFCNITQVGNNLGGLDCILFLSDFY